MTQAQPYRTALVLGLGASGSAAAELLASEGTRVLAVDSRDTDAVRARAAELAGLGIDARAAWTEIPAADVDVCIVSPGIALDDTWPAALAARGVPMLSEFALGASRCGCPILAVTGTNGKSTLVKLCADALRAAGRDSVAAGNYGLPLSAAVRRQRDWIVAEVSSFQLELPGVFQPHAAILLNVQPDHLDRHGSMDAYRAIKARVFDRMGSGSTGVIPFAERDRIPAVTRGRPNWVTFGTGAEPDAAYRDGRVAYRSRSGASGFSVAGTLFDNDILGSAAAAAAAALDACGVPAEVLEQVLRSFEPLPHRMQRVGELGGVVFLNDSKATNLSSVAAALGMCRLPVHLIVGGQLKEKNLDFIKELLERNVRRVYCIGRDGAIMAQAWAGVVPCEISGTLEQAVRQAARAARKGEAVLLSPGCASFDQFRNFEDRGRSFTEIVRSLHEEK